MDPVVAGAGLYEVVTGPAVDEVTPASLGDAADRVITSTSEDVVSAANGHDHVVSGAAIDRSVCNDRTGVDGHRLAVAGLILIGN
ncbi:MULTISPECIES: hypothetical protein [unclassified Nocardioides]|uniref:hypothetical protein n=1 Tax=unclassified Nocardioides TaxID=2615069 RepID=UPI001F21D331|nr:MULTISPECIES: hypothetical protein [unclassified Nocardioides]